MMSALDHIVWKTNTIGFYGFDIMPDRNDKCWLLEVNKCPSMDEGEPVTAQMVPVFLEDLCKLIIDDQ